MSNIRSRRVTKSTKREDFEYNSELESELESDTENHSMGSEKKSDHRKNENTSETTVKQIAANGTNPLLAVLSPMRSQSTDERCVIAAPTPTPKCNISTMIIAVR